MKKTILMLFCLAVGLGNAQDKGGQVAQPKEASEIQAPIPGAPLTPEYVKAVGKAAYLWGWPLVNMHNRQEIFSKAPYPGLLGGIVPAAPANQISMLSDYVDPAQRIVASPNQDVVYGIGFTDLSIEPVVIQVPDFGDRFWVYQIADQRTNSFATMGKMYGTKPGNYMFVGPDWDGEKPESISEVFKSPTNINVIIPRIFMDDTKEDRKAVQPLIDKVMVYPLSEYNGEMKTTDWSNPKILPKPEQSGGAEVAWVVPERYFDDLRLVLEEVEPLPGEEALYAWFKQILEAAENDPALEEALVEVAKETEKEIIEPQFEFRNNGVEAGNGWRTQKNAAEFGFGYFQRTATAKGNMFSNVPFETIYFGIDNDASGDRLNGSNSYTLTFEAGKTPPVDGFWSLTLYNDIHFFYPNDKGRYSLGTKNKDLVMNDDGSLTIYVQNEAPEGKKEKNWLPAPKENFSLYIRAYGPKESALDGSWTPPKVEVKK